MSILFTIIAFTFAVIALVGRFTDEADVTVAVETLIACFSLWAAIDLDKRKDQ